MSVLILSRKSEENKIVKPVFIYVYVQRSTIPHGLVLQSGKTTAFSHVWSHRYAIQRSTFSSDASTQKQSQSPPPPSINNYLWVALAGAIGGLGVVCSIIL